MSDKWPKAFLTTVLIWFNKISYSYIFFINIIGSCSFCVFLFKYIWIRILLVWVHSEYLWRRKPVCLSTLEKKFCLPGYIWRKVSLSKYIWRRRHCWFVAAAEIAFCRLSQNSPKLSGAFFEIEKFPLLKLPDFRPHLFPPTCPVLCAPQSKHKMKTSKII